MGGFETDNERIILYNAFKFDKQHAISEYNDMVINGHGEFILDIWADEVYPLSTTKMGMPIMFARIEAEEIIPSGIGSRFSKYYTNFAYTDGDFILGSNWVLDYEFVNLTKNDINRKCILTRKTAHEENPHVNIMDYNGKLLWKNWVEIEKMVNVYHNDRHLDIEVKLPQINHPMILNWRRFAFPCGLAEKLGKEFSIIEGNNKTEFGTFDINFFKDGRIMSEREVLEILDSNEKLML